MIRIGNSRCFDLCPSMLHSHAIVCQLACPAEFHYAADHLSWHSHADLLLKGGLQEHYIAMSQVCYCMFSPAHLAMVLPRLLQPVQAYMTYAALRVQQQKQREKQQQKQQQQQQEKEQQRQEKQQQQEQTWIPGQQPPKQALQQSRQKQKLCQSTPQPAAAKQVGIRSFFGPVKAKAAAAGAAMAEAAAWAGAAAAGAAGAAAAGAGALASNLSPGKLHSLRPDGAGGLAVANEQSPETSPTAVGEMGLKTLRISCDDNVYAPSRVSCIHLTSFPSCGFLEPEVFPGYL